MKECTVLMTGCGAPGAPGIIRCLRKNGERDIRIVAVDRNENAGARDLVDAFYTVPSAEKEDFLPAVLDICRRESVQVVIPIVTRELMKFARARAEFEEIGAKVSVMEPDKLEITLANVLANIINDEEMDTDYGILKHEEGIDLMPGNIELSGLEVSLVNVMSREVVLRSYVEMVKDRYDYILIDCMPSLGMVTINAFACADSILIPVQAAYLPVKGLEQLIKTIGKVKRQINPKLEIEGILLTMVDSRTNYARDISAMLVENYGSKVRIFENSIPISVRAAEISAEGVSIFQHDPKGKVASAYQSLTEEVLDNE